MNLKKQVINDWVILLIFLFVLSTIGFGVLLYTFTKDLRIFISAFVYVFIIGGLLFAFSRAVRRKVERFSNEISNILCKMMDNKEALEFPIEEESLLSRIHFQLMRLYEILQSEHQAVFREKETISQLVSDISHQVKTPLANLKMINSTLLNRKITEEDQKDFLKAIEGQLDKLDFLMEAMIKTSRLETGMIVLHQKLSPIYETIALALGSVFLLAEKKGIGVDVSCEESLMVFHDKKWTGEVLFNILDNAIKYTKPQGQIKVRVTPWETYTKVDIADNGKGILEKDQGKIFKRFYRGEKVREIEGIGIGLYLARKIITLEGGYIKVSSIPNKKTVFSVFLLNREL